MMLFLNKRKNVLNFEMLALSLAKKCFMYIPLVMFLVTFLGSPDVLLELPHLPLHLGEIEVPGGRGGRGGEGGGVGTEVAAGQVTQFVHSHQYSLQIPAQAEREKETHLTHCYSPC